MSNNCTADVCDLSQPPENEGPSNTSSLMIEEGDDLQMMIEHDDPLTLPIPLVGEHTKNDYHSINKRQNITLTLLLCLSYVMLGFSLSVFGPTLLELASNVQANVASMGLLFTLNGVSYVLSALFVGFMLDKCSHYSHSSLFLQSKARNSRLLSWILKHIENLTMVVGLCLMGLGLVAIPFARNFYLLNVISFLIGLGNGCIDCAANVILVWVWRDQVNPYMQGLHFSFGVGGFICPLYIQLIHHVSLRVGSESVWLQPLRFSYMSLGLLVLIALIPFCVVKFDHEKAPAAEEAQTNTTDPRANTFSVKKLLIAVLTGMALMFYIGSRVGYCGLIHTYVMLQKNTRFTKDSASLLTSFFWFCFTMGRLIAIPLSKVLSVAAMILLDVLFTMSGIAVLSITSNYIVTWIATAVIGLAMASQYPTTISLPSVHLNIKLTGFMTSLMVVCGAFGEMIIPPIMTYFIENLMLVLLVVCGSATIFYLILLFAIPAEKHPSSTLPSMDNSSSDLEEVELMDQDT